MRIYLKPGEKIFVNGAMLRLDRKASVEFLNDVTFLLEGHVIQAEEAKTPLRQLYFVVQTMLIDPANAAVTFELYRHLSERLRQTLTDQQMLNGLKAADASVAAERNFEALKTLRGLFDLEAKLIANDERPSASAATNEREVA
jgi:flagellar biosynthesis repressor protein FlbT